MKMSGNLFADTEAKGTEPAQLSRGAALLLLRLRAGAVGLGDALDWTTNPADLRRWADELRQAGYGIAAEAVSAAGTAIFSLAGGRAAAGATEHGRDGQR